MQNNIIDGQKHPSVFQEKKLFVAVFSVTDWISTSNGKKISIWHIVCLDTDVDSVQTVRKDNYFDFLKSTD